jgi:hypothetical protein
MNPTHDQEVVCTKGCTAVTSSTHSFIIHQAIIKSTISLVSCNELPSDHTFYYKLDYKNHYQTMCILISHSLIVQFLISKQKRLWMNNNKNLWLLQVNNEII